MASASFEGGLSANPANPANPINPAAERMRGAASALFRADPMPVGETPETTDGRIFYKDAPPLGISGGADCFMRAEKFRTARFSGVFRSVRNRCGRRYADGGGRSNKGS